MTALPLNANLSAERRSFVTHLECGLTGARYEAAGCTACPMPGGRCWCDTISRASKRR